MKKYIVIYECKEARSASDQVLTEAGTEVYLTKGEWGPDSFRANGTMSSMFQFKDAMFFDSEELAHKFMRSFVGHPWFHEFNGNYKIVEMKPIYKQVIDGWESVSWNQHTR